MYIIDFEIKALINKMRKLDLDSDEDIETLSIIIKHIGMLVDYKKKKDDEVGRNTNIDDIFNF